MRTRLVTPILLMTLLAACAGTLPGSTTKPGATGGTASTGKPAGAVDCAAIKVASEALIGLQLLAQFTTPETVESIKSKTIGNLDIDAMLSALGDLHALDAYSSPLGDAKGAIEFYEKAAKAAKVLFATEPITQAAIDAYNKENVGTVAAFLGHQIAISGAIDAAGC